MLEVTGRKQPRASLQWGIDKSVARDEVSHNAIRHGRQVAREDDERARVISVAAKYALIEGTFAGRVEDLPREVASKGDVPVRE